METVRVIQLTDTHFLESDATPEGGSSYDTMAAFDAVAATIRSETPPSMVIVTGDITDHGRSEQYEIAIGAFESLDVPVWVVPGNHDLQAPLSDALLSSDVCSPAVEQVGEWTFVFADSNAATMTTAGNGERVDRHGDERMFGSGGLGADEVARVSATCEAADSEHIFLWVHHPPGPPIKRFQAPIYAEEFRQVVRGNSRIRGIGAGHTHVPDVYNFEDVPVFVGPALKENFDVQGALRLPPGFRTLDFMVDGVIDSEVRFVDDLRWPIEQLSKSSLREFLRE